jgi:NAD(P)-dependent dehydrogenase (short-subunit alcohol dehydrogenase family)
MSRLYGKRLQNSSQRGVEPSLHQPIKMSQQPTILISGASRGLGAETAVAAAQLGANLVLTARSQEGLENTARRIGEAGHQGQITLIAGDLCLNEFCRELADQVTEAGPLHAVILNAARIEPIGAVEDIDGEDWLRCIHLNLGSPFLLAKKLLPALTETQGRLITIGTGAATQPIPSWSAYCASKAALLMLTRVIAGEKPEITAFSFAPGVVNTGMQQNIRDRKEMMPAQLAEYFSELHSTGQLEPPEVPARALAWCAIHAPREWTGQEILYSDSMLVDKVRAAFKT